jgi:hypothetical protein
MSNRTLVVLGLVLVALVAAATASMWWPSSPGEARDAASGAEVLGVAGISVEDVDRIEITRAGQDEPIVAERAGRDWTVDGQPAERERVSEFLDEVRGLRRVEPVLVSRSDGRHEGLGLTEEAATRVVLLMGGDEQRSFLVGTAGDGVDSWHGRAVDDDRAWLLRGSLLSRLPFDAATWQQSEPEPAPEPAPDAG